MERANQDVENILACWLRDNNTTNWARGLKFVQWAKNNRHHSGIKCTPYSALFSHEPQLGLRSTTIPAELIDRIDTEEDLQRAISEAETGDNIQPGTTAPITEPEPSHQPPATPQHGMFDLGVDIPISEVDSEISQAMSSSDAEMGVNIQTEKTAPGIEPEPFHQFPRHSSTRQFRPWCSHPDLGRG